MNLKELLDKRGVEYRKTNNPSEILISCTSGEHQDSSPSLSYNLDTDIFHCWSCGFKGGKLKFLQSIGEVTFVDVSSRQPHRIAKLKEKIRKYTEINEVNLPSDRRFFTETFRGIPKTTLKEFNAFTTNEIESLINYVCIPVYQYGKLKFIEGRLYKDLPNQSKYYRYPSSAKVSDCLFPIDKLSNTNHVILVEGLYDMINMWQLGYKNTLCIFGTNSFTKTKLDMLDNRGVNSVDIMMDSDVSGTKAAKKIAEALDTRDIFARIITLPSGIDPGELTKEQAAAYLKL